MAFLYNKTTDQLLGAVKIQTYDLNFSGVTAGDINTGMAHVYVAILNNQTSEDDGLTVPNVDTNGSTAKPGSVHSSGVTTSDLGQLIVIGR